MLILIENANGYALLERNKKKKRKHTIENLTLHSLYHFQTRFEALNSIEKLIRGKVPKNLKKFIKNSLAQRRSLIINDSRLKTSLEKNFGQNSIKIKKKGSLFREVRKNLSYLFKNYKFYSENSKILSLAHSLYCNKLKISGEKIDTMITQAIKLFDDLEKELNNYSMRLREWYGWHFPELSSLISDNIIYAKIVSKIETREKLKFLDLTDFISLELQHEIKEASDISLGVNIFADDLASILSLSGQIISFSEFKNLLQKYIKNRMYTIAPNITAIIGEKVGARLISHAGSLANLSKLPASTIQVLGAEKNLFKAFKNKNFTPKYGIIYHANLINTTPSHIRGKISRITSGKITLSARVDALGVTKYGGSIGLRNKKKIEHRLRQLEGFTEKKRM